MIFVLSDIRVGRGVLWVICVLSKSSRSWLWSVVHPVSILSVLFGGICSLLMFVSDASDDHMVEMSQRSAKLL